MAIEAGARVDVEIDAAKRDEGRHRRVEVDRRRSIERHEHVFVVFVLASKRRAARRRRDGDQNDEHEGAPRSP